MEEQEMKCPICGGEFSVEDYPTGYTQKYQTTGIIMDAERFIITGYKTKKTCKKCCLELTFNCSDKKPPDYSKAWYTNEN